MPIVLTIKEDQDEIAGSVCAVVADVKTVYKSINAAVVGIGSAVCDLVVCGDTALTGSITIPDTLTLRVVNSAVIDYGPYTLTILGRFPWPAGKCFAGSGKVVFGYDTCGMVFPQWWGAKGNAKADGSSGVDCSAALTAAIAASTTTGLIDGVAVHPVYVGQGNWITGPQTFPIALRLFGAGRHSTTFVAKTGTTGKWFTDNGSASKIILEGFAMYGRGISTITHCLQLGRNGVEHGTEGYVRDIWLRDCPSGYGFDVLSNVGIYQNITAQNCSFNIRIGGSPSHCGGLVCMQSIQVGADLSYCTVNGLHIEAPAGLPLRMSRNSCIDGLSISLANGSTLPHLIEFDAACTVWSIRNMMIFFGSNPASVTIQGGNMRRADGTYFGGNATGGSAGANGNLSS